MIWLVGSTFGWNVGLGSESVLSFGETADTGIGVNVIALAVVLMLLIQKGSNERQEETRRERIKLGLH
jgi:hypothetical protein